MILPKLRIDVRYLHGLARHEVGLVTHDPGEDPKHPTLFVMADCNTQEDMDWFDEIVKTLTQEPNE